MIGHKDCGDEVRTYPLGGDRAGCTGTPSSRMQTHRSTLALTSRAPTSDVSVQGRDRRGAAESPRPRRLSAKGRTARHIHPRRCRDPHRSRPGPITPELTSNRILRSQRPRSTAQEHDCDGAHCLIEHVHDRSSRVFYCRYPPLPVPVKQLLDYITASMRAADHPATAPLRRFLPSIVLCSGLPHRRRWHLDSGRDVPARCVAQIHGCEAISPSESSE